MKAFLDTNVLIAACIVDHEHHARALPLMQLVHDRKMEGCVSGHSLLEAHSILTRLPRSPRISAAQASVLIAENIVNHFSIITLTGREYSELSLRLGKDGVIGGKSYDLLHLACAEKTRPTGYSPSISRILRNGADPFATRLRHRSRKF